MKRAFGPIIVPLSLAFSQLFLQLSLQLFLLMGLTGIASPTLAAQITTVRNIGLALPGILYQYNGSPSNVLSSLSDNKANPFTPTDVKATLEIWGIRSRLDLFRQLNKLLNGGSNEHYLYLKQIYQEYQAAFRSAPDSYQNDIDNLYSIDSTQLRNTIRNIWSVYHDLDYNDIRRLVFMWKMADWFEIEPISIQSWDQARIVALVRWGYDMGYLTEQETWPFIERAGTWVIEHFANWNRFVENYIYGRLFEYAGVAKAGQIFRDSALIWWELISPPARQIGSNSVERLSQSSGAWSNIRLQAYGDPQDSFYLQLYRDLYYFQQAVRSGNTIGVQNILDRSDTIIAPELAKKQPYIEVSGYKLFQQPLDQPSARGMYPVILAAIYSEPVMSILVSRGFRYQVADRNGRTALHWAAWNGNVSAISLALQLGLNANQPDNQGKTPIHFAARYNSSLALYRLLQDPSSKQLYPDSEGYTPLHESCYNEKDSNTFGVLLQERYNQLAIDARAGEYQQTPLMIAASLGSAEQIVSLLQRGADPNAKDKRGWTPLHYAAQAGAHSGIRLLLSDGSNINARSKQQETPLLIATREADSRVVALLLQGGANVHYADLQLKRPIHWGAFNADLNVLQLLLQHGADVNALGPNGQTPMHFAAELGQEAHLSALSDAGAELDKSSRFGFTPLMIAVSNRNYEAAKFLIGKNVELNYQIDQNTTLPQESNNLAPAVNTQNINPGNAEQTQPKSNIPRPKLPDLSELKKVQPSLEVNQASLTNNVTDYFGWSPITLAARQGDYQIVWELVEAGAEFQDANIRGWYPIHLAAAAGTTEVLSYLISRGADISQENSDGQSPIELAATDLEHGGQKLRVLLRAGAELNHKDSKGWNAMTYAAMLGNREVVRQLLNQKVDPNDSEISFPPLVAATYSGQQDIIFLLLQRGADPNLRYQDQGTTALHYAVALNRPEIWGNTAVHNIARQLLQAGAVVNIEDNQGNTPLFWAARWGNANMVQLLLQNNANPFQNNQQGLSPFYYALENNYGPSRYLLDSFPLAKINQVDKGGLAPLIRAARFGTERTVALLLATGADINARDINGYSALLYALFARDPGNISTLIRGGYDVRQNITVIENGQKFQLNPLLYAVIKRAPLGNIATLLNWLKPSDMNGLQLSGVAVGQREQEQKTPLHYAIEQRNYDLVQLLLSKGADPNIANADNDTPLIMAVKTQDIKMLELLLEAGAQVNKPGAQYQTPFQVASTLSNIEILNLLHSYGAKGDYGFNIDLMQSNNPNNRYEGPDASPNISSDASPNNTNSEIPNQIDSDAPNTAYPF